MDTSHLSASKLGDLIMLSLNVLLQITSYASCKLHTLQMFESGASGKVAVAQQKIDKSHLSARFAEKFCSARAKYQVAAAQRNQKQDSINYNSIATCPGDSCATIGWRLFQPKVGVKLCWWQFSSATLEAPPICLRFLCPSRRRYMVGWRWSGNSTSTSKAFPWGALAWKICA